MARTEKRKLKTKTCNIYIFFRAHNIFSCAFLGVLWTGAFTFGSLPHKILQRQQKSKYDTKKQAANKLKTKGSISNLAIDCIKSRLTTFMLRWHMRCRRKLCLCSGAALLHLTRAALDCVRHSSSEMRSPCLVLLPLLSCPPSTATAFHFRAF